MNLFNLPIIKKYGHDIWLSELASAGMVLGYGIVLAALLLYIGANTFYQHWVEKKLVETRQEQHRLALQADSLERYVQIYEGIKYLKKGYIRPRQLRRLTTIVAQNSERFGYDPLILLAVIYTESMLNANAMGQKRSGEYSGALGLMQLKFETAQDMAGMADIRLQGEEDLFKPEINIPIGICYLTRMVVRFNSLHLGILAYNQGPEVIRKGLLYKTPLSRGYYHRVMKNYYRLKQATGV